MAILRFWVKIGAFSKSFSLKCGTFWFLLLHNGFVNYFWSLKAFLKVLQTFLKLLSCPWSSLWLYIDFVAAFKAWRGLWSFSTVPEASNGTLNQFFGFERLLQSYNNVITCISSFRNSWKSSKSPAKRQKQPQNPYKAKDCLKNSSEALEKAE